MTWRTVIYGRRAAFPDLQAIPDGTSNGNCTIVYMLARETVMG